MGERMRTKFGRRRIDEAPDQRAHHVPVHRPVAQELPPSFVEDVARGPEELLLRSVHEVERILRADVRGRGPEARWWVNEWSSRLLSHRMHHGAATAGTRGRLHHARALAQLVVEACAYWGLAFPDAILQDVDRARRTKVRAR